MNNKIQFSVGGEAELQMQDLNGAYSQLTRQVNAAFEKLDCGKAKFVSHDQAKSDMAERKAKIRRNGKDR